MGEYLLSIFHIPNTGDVRLTVLALTDDAGQQFPPVLADRRALAEALSFLELSAERTQLPLGDQPLQLALPEHTIVTLLELLETARPTDVAPRHQNGSARRQ